MASSGLFVSPAQGQLLYYYSTAAVWTTACRSRSLLVKQRWQWARFVRAVGYGLAFLTARVRIHIYVSAVLCELAGSCLVLEMPIGEERRQEQSGGGVAFIAIILIFVYPCSYNIWYAPRSISESHQAACGPKP